MKEKKTTIPPAGAVKPTTANKKPLLMMALPIIVAVLLLFVPVPEGLPPYAWHYFAIFVGVIVGLIFEPLPGAVIGITGVVVIALCSQWLLFSPDQMLQGLRLPQVVRQAELREGRRGRLRAAALHSSSRGFR